MESATEVLAAENERCQGLDPDDAVREALRRPSVALAPGAALLPRPFGGAFAAAEVVAWREVAAS